MARHALTARRFRIGVRGITLELLGGYTEMDRDAPSPRVDLLVSLAGPAVSLALGLVRETRREQQYQRRCSNDADRRHGELAQLQPLDSADP